MLDALAAVFLAPDCAACGEPLDRPTAGPVCAGCWASILRFPAHDPRRARGPIACSRAVGPYEGRLRDIVHAFKYDKRRTLATPLAAMMRHAAGGVLDGADAVTSP